MGNYAYYVRGFFRIVSLKTINATFCQHLVNDSVENYGTNRAAVAAQHAQHNNSAAWFKVLTDSCNNLTNLEKDENNPSQDVAWEFSTALFLCMTILTTIGYGEFSPKTSWGKFFCILYGFIGIPIFGIVLTSTSNYFSAGFLHLYERRRPKQQKDKWHNILIAATVFLIPGLAVFLFIPAAIFVYLEGWPFLDATYFSFMTLTTVGFGDIVVAMETNYSQLWIYRICWIFWVMLGIAYWAIIIFFITKALKSKKLRQKWEETSRKLSEQARRMIDDQLSTNGQKKNAFIAFKSKAAFDFALQLTGSMGNVRAELARQPLPGLATAFKPAVPGRGLLSLVELSVKTLGHRNNGGQHPSSAAVNICAPVPVDAEEQVCTSPQQQLTSVITRPLLLVNSHSSSMDSGFDDDATSRISQSSTHLCDSRQSLYETDSGTLSSDNTTEAGTPPKWRSFTRSQTQPELQQHQTSSATAGRKPSLRQLLMEAVLIVEEAEIKEAALINNNQSDE
ncbi:hypothetical protein DAPPUDRAFT_324399 [Daphnia pulex]|uniref:Potassium channel domain-containing protein n=1 Tax=Daphnia pulex TaxID=6669 RepID=E9H1C1_DAPPU|nr:hypothetical protein DAPPUDRAFT_324399 [Daphnia pulex]|eukprot:EFX74420.1 hypothetical protein DAPPUDRAFT_324399 [Daphnia pulex]